MKNAVILMLVGLLSTACGGGGGGGQGPTNPAPVATVSVAPATVQLSRGANLQLTAVLKDGNGAVLLGRNVVWSSDDASKVTVSASGLVTAVAAGNASVSATSEGKTAHAAVAVIDPIGPVQRVTLNTVAERLEEGDAFQLVATAYDAAGRVVEGHGVQWTSTDASVARVDAGGLVTALRPGAVSVSAKIDGAAGSSTISVTASYEFELVYGRADVGAFDELYTLDLRDAANLELPVFAPGKRASHPAPSPDGSRIAFVVYRSGWESTIFVADRDGRNATPLTSLAARNEAPVWSPDGTRIAFASRPSGGASAIWVMNADGSNAVNITADHPAASQASPAWSPRLADGTHRVAYSNVTAGSATLWTARADGSDKRQVTSDTRYYDDEPAWSPDGGALVFQRFGTLHVVASSGGEGRPLMPFPVITSGQLSPTFSPDGRLVAFASKHGGGEFYQIWTVWVDGTRLAQRTFEPLQHVDPAWIVRF